MAHLPLGESAVTYITVSNRQKVSGVAYQAQYSRIIQDRLTLGFAIHDGEVDTLAQQLREQMDELSANKPVQPAALAIALDTEDGRGA